MADITRLRQTLGGPDFAWLIARLRHRLEHGRGLDGSVVLHRASLSQREAYARLFGRPVVRTCTITLRLSSLDVLLRRAELCDGIEEAVVLLSGPLVDRAALRVDVEAQWAALLAGAARDVATRPAVSSWLRDVCATGLLRRLARQDIATARTILQQALEVARRLPANAVPLAELAAMVAGDSHALDVGMPVGTLGVRLAATLGGVQAWATAQDRRDAWAAVGVLCDELSAPVLTVNLRGDTETLTGRALCLHADAGEPYRLSTRQLLRTPATFESASARCTVYVCENPTVVAAVASRLGPRSAPLVCIEGQPTTASRVLLGQLVAAGARLAYHGDFDWSGIQIANLIMTRHGAEPWRFSSAAYRHAATGGSVRLHGAPVAACWDPELEAAMTESGHAVHEEQVLADLVSDLGTDE